MPAVRLWTAWNEPNQPFQLYAAVQAIRGKYVMQSAINYAKICNAVYTGVHATLLKGEKVACGVTAPARQRQPARQAPRLPTPMSFMAAVKKARPEEVRRVGAQPVRDGAARHADDEAARQGSRDARQPRHADRSS